ncbi:MAG: hypothetical protein LBR89_03920 [Holosporales bacterium]|jgi:hypothetical protein|nr:hypothetical protein [Holosporales bacterium]
MPAKTTRAASSKRATASKASAGNVPVALDMFAPDQPPQSMFYKVDSPPPKPPFAPLVMSNCYYKNSARADAMLIIRMLANQSAKSKNFEDFQEQIAREIKIKRGRFDAETMARDALISRLEKKRV